MADTTETETHQLVLDATQYQKGLRDLSSELANANKGLSLTQSASDGVSHALGNLYSTIASKAVSAFKSGYDNMTAYSKAAASFTGDIDGLRSATKGMVSDIELMSAANKKAVLDIDVTDSQYKTMMSDVAKLSKVMGGEFTDNLEKAEMAIARQNSRGLAQIGIIVNAKSAYEDYANAHGKLVKDLTDEEKQTAFTAAALEKMHDRARQMASGAETLTGIMKKAGVEVSNWGAAIGSFLNEQAGSFVRWLYEAQEPVDIMQRKLHKVWEEYDKLNDAFRDTTALEKSGLLASSKYEGRGAAASMKGGTGEAPDTEGFGTLGQGDVGKEMDDYFKALADKRKKSAEAAKKIRDEENASILEDMKYEGEFQNDLLLARLAHLRKESDEKKKAIEDQANYQSKLDRQIDKYRTELASSQRSQNNKFEEERVAAAKKAMEKLVSKGEKSFGEGKSFLEQLLPEDQYDRFMEKMGAIDERAAALIGTMTSGLQGASDAIGGALADIISGEKSAGDAFRDSFNKWLSQKCQQWAMQAVEEGVLALASLAMENYAGAAKHAAASAGFAGLAALAGVGAAATASPKSSSSSSKGSDRGLGGSSSSASRGGGNVSFTYNINTLTTKDDDVAALVAGGYTRAVHMGYIPSGS